MRIEIHHYWHNPGPATAEVVQLLHQVLEQGGRILEQGRKNAMHLAKLAQEVSENTEAIAGAITLIEGIAAELREKADDETAILALADQLDENSTKLAEAVAANTPADPSVEPEESEE